MKKVKLEKSVFFGLDDMDEIRRAEVLAEFYKHSCPQLTKCFLDLVKLIKVYDRNQRRLIKALVGYIRHSKHADQTLMYASTYLNDIETDDVARYMRRLANDSK